jgi:hypothetical protein
MSDLILNKDETLPQIVAGRFRNQTDMQGSKSPRNEPQSSSSRMIIEKSQQLGRGSKI